MVVVDGTPLSDATITTGKVVFTTPPSTPGTAEVYLAREDSDTQSNKVEFTYNKLGSADPKWAYKKVASGAYTVVEYCYGYIFTATRTGKTGSSG